MTLALREAIYARWNNSGLSAVIAPLYPGDQEAAPEQTPLPRAQYELPSDIQRTRSRSSRELLQDLRLHVWGSDDATVQQHLDLMEAAFVDSEAVPVNPLSISLAEGRVLSVDYVGKAVIQEAASVFQGILQLRIQWCRPISI